MAAHALTLFTSSRQAFIPTFLLGYGTLELVTVAFSLTYFPTPHSATYADNQPSLFRKPCRIALFQAAAPWRTAG